MTRAPQSSTVGAHFVSQHVRMRCTSPAVRPEPPTDDRSIEIGVCELREASNFSPARFVGPMGLSLTSLDENQQLTATPTPTDLMTAQGTAIASICEASCGSGGSRLWQVINSASIVGNYHPSVCRHFWRPLKNNYVVLTWFGRFSSGDVRYRDKGRFKVVASRLPKACANGQI
jgi:hypothetical protein